MVLSTCPHYENYVKTNGFEFYDLIVKNFIGPKRKIKQVICQLLLTFNILDALSVFDK